MLAYLPDVLFRHQSRRHEIQLLKQRKFPLLLDFPVLAAEFPCSDV